MTGQTYNFDFFQIEPHKVDDDWAVTGPDNRAYDARISNFNSMYRGARRSDDYTRTILSRWANYIENPQKAVGVGFGTDPGEYIYNPYKLGETVKRMLDDQAFKMGIAGIGVKHDDVSDMDEATAEGIKVFIDANLSFLNFPTEGWSSFGKKYDKHTAYVGS